MATTFWAIFAIVAAGIVFLACYISYSEGRSEELNRVKDIVIKRYAKFTSDYETERNTISKDGVTFLKPVPRIIGVVAKEVFDKVLEELDEEEKTIGNL